MTTTDPAPASMGGPLSEAEREYRERVEFMSRLGFGDDKTERAARLPEIVDNVEEAFAAAHDHYECPFYCNHCGERLADKDCEECHGAGGHVVQGAYSECSNCGGDMRIHEGCAEKSYADLVAENALLGGQLATAQAELEQQRWYGEQLQMSIEGCSGNHEDIQLDEEPEPRDLGHEFLPVNGHPDDDECTHRADGTDDTYCGEPKAAHAVALGLDGGGSNA